MNRRDNLDQFRGLGDIGVVLTGEYARAPQDAEPEGGIHELPQDDSSLGETVPAARAAVGFLIVGSGGSATQPSIGFKGTE